MDYFLSGSFPLLWIPSYSFIKFKLRKVIFICIIIIVVFFFDDGDLFILKNKEGVNLLSEGASPW